MTEEQRIPCAMRGVNPCKGCTRPEKRPGCHDSCPFRQDWIAEFNRIKAARREYEIRRGYR